MKISRRTAAKSFLATAAGSMMPARNLPASETSARQASEERIRTQVCVIGAGSGGTGAALAAARAGAEVVLLERDSCLGGTATNGMVCVWRAVSGCNGIPRDLFHEPSAPEKARMILNGLTLCYRITDTGVKQKPYLPSGIEAGKCSLSACFDRMPNGDYVVNVVPMLPGNAVLCYEYSQLMRRAQERVLDHFFQVQNLPVGHRWSVPGQDMSTWTISAIAPRIGVRETRRIVADYMLNENDLNAGVAKQGHADVIAIADHSVDLHARGVKFRTLEGPFGIPYRCLLPKGVKNLLIACRAAGFSHIAAASCRLQRTLITLGQAAGNAAALAVKNRADLRQIDVRQLQARLQSQNVELTAPAETDRAK